MGGFASQFMKKKLNVYLESKVSGCQECFHKLLWAMTQLHLIAIGNSDINPPEKFFSDGGTLPVRA